MTFAGKHHSPEARARISAGNKGKRKGVKPSLETCMKISKNHADFKGDKHPQFGKHHSEETKVKISAHQPDRSGDKNQFYGKTHTTEAREKMSRAGRANNHNRGKHLSEETRRKISDAHNGLCPSPETRVKLSHAWWGREISPETRAKMSASRMGEKNPRWCGGKSFEPYCIKFNRAFKDSIRDRFNQTCYLCGCRENYKRHAVHHIDYNKSSICNGRSWGFVLLCPRCHARANNNRWYWFNLFISYWIASPAMNYCSDP